MPKKFGLKDVDPRAITLCKKGANNKRIFLRKSDDGHEPPIHLRDAPLIRKADDGGGWAAAYCVVAEPGWEEQPGQTGDPDSVDVWVDADEIRKSAHRLLKNQAYVNGKHDEPALEGCTIVESAVALADFDILDPNGVTETIKKDSWYVAIEPSEEIKKQIDDGEIEAISLEGDGLRVPLEKSAEKPASDDRGMLRKLWAKLTDEPLPAEFRKTADFAEVIAERELTDDLWKSWSALEGVIFDAFRSEDEPDPKGVIARSLDQFRDYLLAKLDSVPVEDREGLAKELATLEDRTSEEETDMGLREDFDTFKQDQEAQTADLKKSADATTAAVEGLTGLVDKVIDRLEGSAKKDDADPDEKTEVKKTEGDPVELLGKLADRMDSFDDDLQAIAKAIDASSTQDGGGDKIQKTDKDNPLAGLLQL